MRKVLVSIAVASAALIAAAPASAQPGYYGGGYNAQRGYGYQGDRGLVNRFEQQIAQLQQRIDRSAQRRAITPNEYRALRQHANDLRRRLYNFARNGLTRGESQDIADRIDNLRDRIRDERQDGRRYGGRGW
jgi:chromosome segregation ATPase